MGTSVRNALNLQSATQARHMLVHRLESEVDWKSGEWAEADTVIFHMEHDPIKKNVER